MTKKTKKGFTLTELIVVIAIIAILAAVLIPTSISFIKKAKFSNDSQLAASMTKEIGYYCIENDVDQNKLLGTDIRTLLLFRGYDLIPKTKDWSFWYNDEDKKVEVIENEESNISAAGFNEINANPLDPTNIYENYYLLGKGETEEEKVINFICTVNPNKLNTYLTDVVKLTNNTNLLSFCNNFAPSKTLYINNSSYYTEANGDSTIERIVYLEQTTNIPKITEYPISFFKDDAISNTSQMIKSIEDLSLLKSYFPKVKNTSELSLKIIDVKPLENFKDDLSYVYEFTLGEYFDANGKQDIKTEIITSTCNVIEKDEENYLVTNDYMRFVVSYYNENGLYARGETTFSIISEKLIPASITISPTNTTEE